MIGRFRLLRTGATLGCAVAALGALLSAMPAMAQEIDTALCLGMDVSGSVDDTRFELQRHATASVLRSPRFLAAVLDGEHQILALAVFEWSSKDEQRVILPWMLIRTKADAESAAKVMETAPRSYSGSTGVAAAMVYGVKLLLASPGHAARRVLDISGDGPDNEGGDMGAARALAEGAGVIVNGLPILNRAEPRLESWYRLNVPVNHGFSIPALGFADFEATLLSKVEREISALPTITKEPS